MSPDIMNATDYDFAVIGAGFYGLALALVLRSTGARVVVLEVEQEACTRASRVNQARVHTGFHYPRSFVTAMRSLALHRRFANDFHTAVVDDFDMLYAIARKRSKVSAGRFQRMFEHMGAPLEVAPRHLAQLFDEQLVERVFRVHECAFDYRVLRDMLLNRATQAGVTLHMGTAVERVTPLPGPDGPLVLNLSRGEDITTGMAFNVTYAGLNQLLIKSDMTPLPLKHEFVELALVDPVPELKRLAITLMDGPFFSLMPYPAAGAYSLTHVRYTPHGSWSDAEGPCDINLDALPRRSRWVHMQRDAQRYMPCLEHTVWRDSLFDIKTIPIRHERDDGRPILMHRHAEAHGLVSIMGGKIDNIYDMFQILPQLDTRLASARADALFGRPT
ncbi:FAD-dependent oxidoreductase [Castellaniella sp.]|uniref:FAD-dependent oxidoreductase n=1 Tax=Castellaniella sp. TaxID=1955812 RepID=UPI002AFFA749|nr:FAD-dependent oxidoreductase [Castellaniella sp.]